MPQLHLPSAHTNADLVLAAELAQALDAEELFVAWTHDAPEGAPPEVTAVVREPVHPVANVIAALAVALGVLAQRLVRGAPEAAGTEPEPSRAARQPSWN